MNKKLKWLLNSRAYRKAKSAVTNTLKRPAAIKQLVESTNRLLTTRRVPALDELVTSIRASLRLLRCYVSGEYRDVSIETLGLIVSSLLYLVMPLDFLPDFILGLGFSDDALLLVYTFKSVAEELQKFLRWEEEQKAKSSSRDALNPSNASLEDLSDKSD